MVAAASALHCKAADPYPIKPIRIIAAFPPGGFVDLCARVVSGPLGAAFGQQVVVDNRGGAGGIVGTELAARAVADGYTLLVGSVGTHAVNQTLYRKLPYHVLRDFQPVTRLDDRGLNVKTILSVGVTQEPHIKRACMSMIFKWETVDVGVRKLTRNLRALGLVIL